MVNLVLKGNRQQPFALTLNPFPLQILIPHLDPAFAFNAGVIIGHRQTPFLFGALALTVDNLWIHRTDEIGLFFAVTVYDNHPFQHPNLRGGQPYSRCGIHGIYHVRHQAGDLLINVFNWHTHLGQKRIRIVEYLAQCHNYLSPVAVAQATLTSIKGLSLSCKVCCTKLRVPATLPAQPLHAPLYCTETTQMPASLHSRSSSSIPPPSRARTGRTLSSSTFSIARIFLTTDKDAKSSPSSWSGFCSRSISARTRASISTR